jgi:hypothetical protein
VFRERFADELGAEPLDLDEQVATVVEQMIGGLVSPVST